jgi:hypothetical protein
MVVSGVFMRDLYEFLFQNVWDIARLLKAWRFVITLIATVFVAMKLHDHLPDNASSRAIIAGVCLAGVVFGIRWERNA